MLGALVVGVVTVAYSLSFAALIFSGELAGAMPQGLMAALIGAAVSALVVGRYSSLAGATAGLDTPTMAVVATMAAAIAARISVDAIGGAAVQDHVLAAVVSSTLLTGAVLVILGRFRLGQWMRFIPYPVVGGFLAASGFLLSLGAVKVITGLRPGFDTLAADIDPQRLWPLLVGAAFAAGIGVTRRASQHFAAVPVVVLLGTLALHAALHLAGLDIEQAQQRHWLLPPLAEVAPWNPWRVDLWLSLDWPSLLLHAGELGAAVGVTAVAVLLNATGLEVDQRTHADIDRELAANGCANLLSGALGGMIGNLSLNRSRLNIQAGGASPVAGPVVALVCVAFLFHGRDLAGLVPTPVLGGLLLYLGGAMLYDWLGRTRRRMSPGDYLLVLAIAVAIVNFGYLPGALLGMIAASVLFVLRYSRVRVIKHRMNAREYASYVERAGDERRVLNQYGGSIRIFQLQGYLFFGTANSLFEEVRESVATQAGGPGCCVVLDFRLVSGSDSSAVFSFVKMMHLLERGGWQLLLSSVRPDLQRMLEAEHVVGGGHGGRVFDSLDLALEAAEDALLASRGDGHLETRTLAEWLNGELDDEDATTRIIAYLQRFEVGAGEAVCRQGEPSDEIYLAVSGRISILLSLPGQGDIRLRSMAKGTLVGEMGFFRDVIRTASVVAEQPTVLYRLDRAGFRRMQQEDPLACIGFQRFVIRVLSDRLAFANSEISALQR